MIMSINTIEQFHQSVGDQIVKEAGSFLGENLDHIRSAVNTLVPAVFRGLIEKNSDLEGGGNLLDYIKENFDAKLLEQSGGIFGGGPATNDLLEKGDLVIQQIFGKESAKTDEILDMVSSSNQIHRNSSETLLKMVAPVALNLIGKEIQDRQLDAQGLQELLQSQMETVMHASPMALTDIFDRAKVTNDVQSTPQKNQGELPATSDPQKPNTLKKEGPEKESSDGEEPATIAPKPSFVKRMGPWFILFILAGIMFWGMRSCGGMPPELKRSLSSDETELQDDALHKSANPDQIESDQTESTPEAADAIETVEKHVIDLPGGATLAVAKGSFAQKVSAFLSSGARAAEGRFALDGVKFNTGMAEVTEVAGQQLQHLAYLLQAYPTAQIRVECRLKSEGDAPADLALSEQRALSIKKRLNELGVANERIEATGYGSEGLDTNTDTQETATNQRVEVVVITR